MTNSTPIKNQKKTFTKYYTESGKSYKIVATIRHDDECGNGYNTFAITANIYEIVNKNRKVWIAGGCQHEEIKKHFPELAKYIKWHLCGTDGPMHYIANTLYLAGDRDCWGHRQGKQRNFEAARVSAIWEDATNEELSLPADELKQKLIDRLPALMAEFKKDVEKLGFIY